MFDHVSIGVRDMSKSGTFYDVVLAPLGYRRLSDGEESLGYGNDGAVLWLYLTNSPVPNDPKSGLHFCFAAPNREAVAQFHAAALAAGGKDNGAPGIRADYGADYYAAYAVDPDGYRLEALRLGA